MKNFSAVTGKNWLQGRKLLPLLERHGRTASGCILDLGCGGSPWRHLFSGAREFMRMDRAADDRDVIIIENIYELPIGDAAIDVVILSRVLGDIPDQPRLMGELARVLAPTGRILVYESISYPQHDLPHDYWRVLPEGLAWAAGQGGLKVAELVYCGGYFTQVAVQLNSFIIGDLGGSMLARPLAAGLRSAVNFACAGLDRIIPRPQLAADYFACLVKSPPVKRL